MQQDDLTTHRYLCHDYALKNPTWDSEDSPWKAKQVMRMLRMHGLTPNQIVEVGCGAGGVLAELRTAFPQAELFGFDIAPDATRFWSQHASTNIKFTLGDFFELNQRSYELMLVLDVIEHLPNPFDFLTRLRSHAKHYMFHFPLDLSALSVLRETPLLYVRNKVGHIHYYTKNLALALLSESGYQVVDCFYTDAAFASPQRTWKTRLASLPRRLAYAFNKDAGVRLLGGETLLVLARSKVSK